MNLFKKEMSIMDKMQILYFRLKEMIFKEGRKWEKKYPIQGDVREFAEQNINTELDKEIGGEYTGEYIVVSTAETLNDRIRSGRIANLEDSINKGYLAFAKYQTKVDLVVYRGVCENVFKSMKKSFFKFHDKAFLCTSLLKGHELDQEYKLRILIPKGTKAAYMGNLNGEEEIFYEVIVQKGAVLRIVSFDGTYWNCKVESTD